MSELFYFDWPVDQDGYEIEHREAVVSSTILGSSPAGDWLRTRGGPLRYYRPMDDHPGLWRQFADTCTDLEGARSFADRFGLLRGGRPERVEDMLGWAAVIRQIAALFDDGNRLGAARVFSEQGPARVAAAMTWNGDGTQFDFQLRPLSLISALLLQTGETIKGNRIFRRCKNDGCGEWFRLGPGAHTARRAFCSNRCRVAWARRHKQGSPIDA